MKNQKFFKAHFFLRLVIGATVLISLSALPASAKKNILFLAVDDLNDWVGPLGGHPQAKTPNFDRLADMGVTFTNAHCQASVCNPSRGSIMSSIYPSTSGIYFLSPGATSSPAIDGGDFLNNRFAREGYDVSSRGKIFHGSGQFGPMSPKKLGGFPGHGMWAWGAYPDQDSKMPDYGVANSAVQALGKTYSKPFLIMAGFSRPHVPQYVPQKWFDLYADETLILPEVIENDRIAGA